jgi:hypothetical protein
MIQILVARPTVRQVSFWNFFSECCGAKGVRSAPLVRAPLSASGPRSVTAAQASLASAVNQILGDHCIIRDLFFMIPLLATLTASLSLEDQQISH